MDERIVVLGSINRDIVYHLERLPGPGETILARETAAHRGGKGANQAVAIARLGRPVSLIGRVGTDLDGTNYMRALVSEGVDVDHVIADMNHPTGNATILLADDGENSIVVLPGANGAVARSDVTAAQDLLASSAVILAQLEVPMDAVVAAAALARGTFILNAAPARALPAALLEAVDILVVNRSELALLAGSAESDDTVSLADQARSIRGPGAVVVTLGGRGALLVEAGGHLEVPAVHVDVVDTTGAGDAFCGALADAVAGGTPLAEAARWAVRVSAVATTRVGAQSGLPTRDLVTVA